MLGLSAAGFPLTQLAIRRFGRRGAIVTEGACAGLAVRDAAMIAAGTPAHLRRGPAFLLWLELAAAVAAAGLGVGLATGDRAVSQAAGWRPVLAREGASRRRWRALRPAHRAVLDLPATRSRAEAGSGTRSSLRAQAPIDRPVALDEIVAGRGSSREVNVAGRGGWARQADHEVTEPTTTTKNVSACSRRRHNRLDASRDVANLTDVSSVRSPSGRYARRRTRPASAAAATANGMSVSALSAQVARCPCGCSARIRARDDWLKVAPRLRSCSPA